MVWIWNLKGSDWCQAHFQYLLSRRLFPKPQMLYCYFSAPTQHCGARVPTVNQPARHTIDKQGRAAPGTANLRRSCQLLPHYTEHHQSWEATCTAQHILVLAHLQHQPALSCTTSVSMGSHHPLLGGRGPEQDEPRAVAISCPELGLVRSDPSSP